MGFGPAESSLALSRCKNSVDRAVEFLASLEEAALEADDSLLALLTQLSLTDDTKLKVVPYKKSKSDLVMQTVGYRKRGAFWVLEDREGLAGVVAVLEKVSAFRMENSDEAAKKAAVAVRSQAAYVPAEEPTSGARVTIITDKKTLAVRVFDSDDTLGRVVRFIASLEDTPKDFVDGHSWRVVEEGNPPFFWCDAWILSVGGTVLKPEDSNKTIATLGLWPGGIVRVSSIQSPSPPRQRVMTKKATTTKPSEMRRQVLHRFDDSPLQEGRKQHVNVAKSVDATPGLHDLLAMGFAEDKSRAALKKSSGNLERALEALLLH